VALPSDLKDSYDRIVSVTNGALQNEVMEPYWSIENPDDLKRLDWLRRNIEATEMNTLVRMEGQLINRFAARNIHWEYQDPFGFHTNTRKDLVDSAKISVPDQYRYLENVTSRLLRFKAATYVGPATNEFGDKQGARVVRMLSESVRLQYDFDELDARMVRRLPTDGDAFMLVLWDEQKGETSERWKKANKKYGKKKHSFDDWDYDPKMPEKIGDFDFVLPQPWRMRFDPLAEEPKTCQHCTYIEHLHVKEIISRHPEFKAQIESSALESDFVAIHNIDTSSAQNRTDSDLVPYMRFWHRKHRELPDGAYIVFIPGLILKEEENPYSSIELLDETPWGDLPIESLSDLHVEGNLHGYPTMSLVASFNRARNQILTAVNRNARLHMSPKLMVHVNSDLSIEALASGATILKWSGQVPPELKNFASISPELIGFYQMLGEEIERSINQHPISGGTPPKGITAGTALRLLEEIQDRLLEQSIKRMNRMVVNRDKRVTGVAGKFFKKSDKRLLRIVGEDNADIIEELDTDALTKKYNYRIEPVAANSKSAASRKQDVIDTLQYGPENVMTPEQVLDAMELNRPEKITDPAQTSVAAAERIIEMVSSSKELPLPRRGENYMVKWKIFMGYYQRPGFLSLPEKRQIEFVDMVSHLEFLMDEQALKNPMYLQVLMTTPDWPAFYHASSPAMAMEMQQQAAGQKPPTNQQPGQAA